MESSVRWRETIMANVATARLGGWLAARRGAELRLAVRVTVAGVATFALATAGRRGTRRFHGSAGRRAGEGLIRTLTVDDAGRLYAVSFALEQLRKNFEDMSSRTAESARPVAAPTPAGPDA